MANDLAVLEQQLVPMMPKFEEALTDSGIPIERFRRTIMRACEKEPMLASPDLFHSLVSAAMTSAVLRLEADGVHGAIVLYRGKRPVAQFIAMYQGYIVQAARGMFTLTGHIVREGDEFDYQEGTDCFIRFKTSLEPIGDRKVIAAWAKAESKLYPPLVNVMSMDAMEQHRRRSKGPVWKTDPEAMYRKTPIRMLAKDVPFSDLQMLAAMEMYADIGRPAHMEQGGILNITPESPYQERQPEPDPKTIEASPFVFAAVMPDNSRKEFGSAEEWGGWWLRQIERLPIEMARTLRYENDVLLALAKEHAPDIASDVLAAFKNKIGGYDAGDERDSDDDSSG